MSMRQDRINGWRDGGDYDASEKHDRGIDPSGVTGSRKKPERRAIEG
jgi:hypothetical protein